MNRSQRRTVEKKAKNKIKIASKEELRGIVKEEVSKRRDEYEREIVDKTYRMLLAIPAFVINDKFSSLIRLDVDGKGRVERFIEACDKTYDAYIKGYISLEDIISTIKEDTGYEYTKI